MYTPVNPSIGIKGGGGGGGGTFKLACYKCILMCSKIHRIPCVVSRKLIENVDSDETDLSQTDFSLRCVHMLECTCRFI